MVMLPLRVAALTFPMLVCTIVALAASGKELQSVRSPNHRQENATRYFESKVRPLLEKHCIPCHGPTAAKAGLRFDTKSGYGIPGIVISRNPSGSLLMKRVRAATDQMPPSGHLASSEIKVLEDWIVSGAFDPRVSKGASDSGKAPQLRGRPFQLTPADRKWWAFQPIQPPVAGASIDQLLAKARATKGIKANPPASPRERVRRAYFDLWGLPPSPADVAAFEANPSDTEWGNLIDKLLASPHFGERWGRHWLDIVRYAETNGYERDSPKPFAWRYRDWVIQSINQDKPYDRFVLEQLAGDELKNGGDDALIATGYYRLHVWDDEPDSTLAAEYDDFDDIMVTTGAAFLGLTLGCARCHDHKYDPISQRDYYSLLAFFRGIDPYGQHKTGGGGRGTGKILKPLMRNPSDQALCAIENGVQPRETFVLIRGDAQTPAEKVKPAVPGLFVDQGNITSPAIPPLQASSSGYRTAIASWIASPRNPLTPRVMANRIWQHLFGTGIVATPDDFGATGLPPSNQQLLDYLARRLVTGGWKLKPLIREVMLSKAYQQASMTTLQPHSQKLDPDNKLVWRQNLRRLEAEGVRDTLLVISGELNTRMYGPSVFPTLPPDVRDAGNPANAGWVDSTPDEQKRRSVYLVVKRALKVPFLEALDFANSTSPAGVRSVTTTAPQALMFLNDAFMHDRAVSLAKQLVKDSPNDQLGGLFQRALQRKPTAGERAVFGTMIGKSPTLEDWIRCCRVVLNLNEVIYVD